MRISFLVFLLLLGNLTYGQDVQKSDDVFFTQYKAENSSLTVNQIKIDNNNRIIVATDKMLFTITSVGDIPKKILNNTYVKSITYDEASNIYAAGKNLIYDIKNNVTSYLPDTNLNIIDIEVLGDDLWVGTDSGLYRYSIANKNWDEYNTRNSKLASNRINFVDKDSHGVIWIGTTKGYVKVHEGKWELEDKKHDINATRSNTEGQWMVSTDDMWLIDPFNRKYDVGLEDNMHEGRVNDFVIDSKGRIYMASNILVRYDPYEETLEQYGRDVGIISQKCITLAADKNDNIWLGTADAGLFKMTFGTKRPDALTATILLENRLNCAGNNNASFVVSTAGGVPPYDYAWNDGSNDGSRRKGLGKGIYTLTVTDDIGTTAEASIEISEPQPIEIDVHEKRNVSEPGAKDGAISVGAKGGTGRLTYSWSNGMTGANIARLSPGSYILTVKDQNNCTAIKEISIGDAKNLPQLTQGNFEVGNILTINNLTFAADSASVEVENYAILNEVYAFLKKNPKVVIEIGGHTNTIPPHEYCDRLSTLRAKSVAEYIINQGIDPSRVTYKGYGKRKPLIDSRSLEARKKNQRVEIKILQT